MLSTEESFVLSTEYSIVLSTEDSIALSTDNIVLTTVDSIVHCLPKTTLCYLLKTVDLPTKDACDIY